LAWRTVNWGGGEGVEADVIARTVVPATTTSLHEDLRGLGLVEGAVVLVHSSLSSIGWTVGGAEAVIEALRRAVGAAGTLMLPAHSAQLTDPSTWDNPPVPEAWWPTIREAMPPYDPVRTPTAGMGVVAETFRRLPGVGRSRHPTGSFAASGPLSQRLLGGQTLDDGFGENSPLARLYDVGGWVLLLGVGHASNTSLHLAEYRSAARAARRRVASPMRSGRRVRWVTYWELPQDTADFPVIGAAFEAETRVTRISHVGAAEARLMPVVDLVDFASVALSRLR